MEPAGWVPPGGVPWQEVQARAVAVQAMGLAPTPFLKLPWQYVLEQVGPVYEGAGYVVPVPVFASVPKAMPGCPSACSGFTGMAALWHSPQATCLE